MTVRWAALKGVGFRVLGGGRTLAGSPGIFFRCEGGGGGTGGGQRARAHPRGICADGRVLAQEVHAGRVSPRGEPGGDRHRRPLPVRAARRHLAPCLLPPLPSRRPSPFCSPWPRLGEGGRERLWGARAPAWAPAWGRPEGGATRHASRAAGPA